MATTLIRMMKKAASSVIPLANRTTPSLRNCTNAILSTRLKTSTTIGTNLCKKTSIPTHNHFCAVAEKQSDYDDTDLLSAIESELDNLQVVQAPIEFPFTREYHGEKIDVIVHGPHDEEDEEEIKQESDRRRQYVFLNVYIKKKSGQILEFHVSANADGFKIRSRLEVKNAPHDYSDYEEPYFHELDENLQKAFHQYLEVRGFEPSTAKFFLDYEVQKMNKEYIEWLKDLRNYIADFNSNSSTSNLSTEVPQATSVPKHHSFSTLAEKSSNADDILLSVIESEIKCADEKFHEFAKLPGEFPFKIKGKGRRSIILTREYQGEEIEVEVEKPYNLPEKSYPYAYNLTGSVSNKSGLTLKFEACTTEADGIKIRKFDVKDSNASVYSDYYNDYNTAHFWELDENLQKAFCAYLEVRGFEPNIGKILHGYMVRRKHKKYTAWLKIFKNFISN